MIAFLRRIDWFRFVTWLLVTAIGVTFWSAGVLFFVGCSWSQQTREKERTTEQNVVRGDVGGVPVNLEHQRTTDRVRDEDQQGTRETGLEPVVGAVAQAAAGGGSMLTGGGAGLAIGLVGMGFAWWKKRQADAALQQTSTALQQTVAGVEAAKGQMSPAEVDILHNSLSKTMDAAAKERVRMAKAKV